MAESTDATPTADSGVSTLEHAGFTITSTDGEKQAKDSLAQSKFGKPKDGEEKEPEKTTAQEAGRKGGQATAAIRRREAREAAKAEPEQEAEVEPEAPEEDEGAKAKAEADEEISKAPREERKKLASERVAQATREAAELKRQLAAERAERERLIREFKESAPKQETKPQPAEDEDPEPNADDYPEWQAWLKDHNKWSARQAAKEYVGKANQERVAKEEADRWGRAAQEHLNTFLKRLGETPQEVNEFVSGLDPEVQKLWPSYLLEPGTMPTGHNVVADQIADSEHSKTLLLLFDEHPQELQRIASLRTPREIVREMAKLEARLEVAMAGASTPERVPSKAPNPPQPVRGGAAPAVAGRYREGMTVEEYAKGWKPAARR